MSIFNLLKKVLSPRLAAYLQKKGYSVFPMDAVDYTTNMVNQILARRREHLERRNDFIQIMVDHEEEVDKSGEQWGTLKKSMNDNLCALIQYLFLGLTDKEIFGQAMVFMVGGVESTSVLMSFFVYVMATEPLIQEKVYDEIRQELGDVSELDAGDHRYLRILFRVKLLMTNCISCNIWIWLLMKLFECIHHLSG